MYTRAKIALHEAYPKVLQMYNDEHVRTHGNVNDLKFYRDVILQYMPGTKQATWYQFLTRFKTQAGIIAKPFIDGTQNETDVVPPELTSKTAENKLAETLRTNEEATQSAINIALNVGLLSLREIVENPEVLKKFPPKDRIELLFKAMRAQDSRIHAIGAVREDKRKQDTFNRAFNDAASGQ